MAMVLRIRPIWPVVIASKGRPSCPTLRALGDLPGGDVRVFVEPQDVLPYAAQHQHAKLVSLPEDDQGLPYARNWITDWMRQYHGTGWFWMLDDDFTGFYRGDGSKVARVSAAEALRGAQAVIDYPHVAMGALEYQQYAWGTKPPHYRDFGHVDNATAIHTGRVTPEIRWRDQLILKSDRDLMLQVIRKGWTIRRSTQWAYAAPKEGSNAGGLHDTYESGVEREMSARLIALWPGVCTWKIKSDGRPDVRINWKRARPSTATHAGGQRGN